MNRAERVCIEVSL